MRHKVDGVHRWGAAVFLLAAVGCGQSVYPVKGQINFEGSPMAGGGAITFVPLENQAGKAAGGEIAADGTYVLSTNGNGDGSMTGEFRVVITQSTETEPEASPDGSAPKKTGKSLPAAQRIPTIYADAYNSPLRAKVEAKNPNVIDFNLKRSDQPQQGPPGGGAMLHDPLRNLYAALKQ